MRVQEQGAERRQVKLTAEDFLQLADAGALDAYPKTELLDGVIVAVSPQHSEHGRVHSEFFLRLAEAVKQSGAAFRTWVEVSVRLSDHQVPQADIVVTSYRGPRAVLTVATMPLVVEIADTTAAFDRGTKARLYAAGGIAEYWVVDIQAAEIARFWLPGPDDYGRKNTISFGQKLAAMTLAGIMIETDDL